MVARVCKTKPPPQNQHNSVPADEDYFAAVTQRAWRKLHAVDVLGKRLLREGKAVKQFKAADYDADELTQEAWPASLKWHALQHAPAFIQSEPAADMKYETQRLILARLVGDLGDAVHTVEEMEMVFTACKVVGGLMGKTHVLSTGECILEVEGFGAYEASGSSTSLMTTLDMEASRKGYKAIILLSTPAAVRFYSRFGYTCMETCSLEPADAVYQALHYLSANAIYRHAPMVKFLR
ncbi:ACOT13 [Symbiodinium natans]|uniref:ACOT13 protein n=1 Tax=Symbiodinium natans TaxID=878477 RepID=A0A812QFJ8_9DINO|nr:ACOT13 [Symbiodinium natans]